MAKIFRFPDGEVIEDQEQVAPDTLPPPGDMLQMIRVLQEQVFTLGNALDTIRTYCRSNPKANISAIIDAINKVLPESLDES